MELVTDGDIAIGDGVLSLDAAIGSRGGSKPACAKRRDSEEGPAIADELERDRVGNTRGRASLNDSSASGSAGTGRRLSHFGVDSDADESFLDETRRFDG